MQQIGSQIYLDSVTPITSNLKFENKLRTLNWVKSFKKDYDPKLPPMLGWWETADKIIKNK